MQKETNKELRNLLSDGLKIQERRARKASRKVSNGTLDVTDHEKHLIQQAIEQSMKNEKTVDDDSDTSEIGDLDEVEPMKTYYPTDTEFENPIKYIEQLYKDGVWKYGCIKIVPPTSFKPEFVMNYKSTMKMPYKQQNLHGLKHNKDAEYHPEGITYEEFKKKATLFESQYCSRFEGMSEEEKFQALQEDYWNIVEYNSSESYEAYVKNYNSGEFIKTNDEGESDFNVIYAADLNTNKYPGGFPTPQQSEEYGNHPMNFKNLNYQEDSLLQIAKNIEISGINIPWLYLGMMYSSFAWHYEDIMLYSINYMHEGAGKIWYGIPSHHRAKFEKLVKEKREDLAKEDPNFLFNINSMINPGFLAENGVKVYKTWQKPGEFIMTFPESYHAGFSAGFNVAEAVNFAAPSWLNYVDKAMRVYLKSREKIPVFPVQWLAIEISRNFSNGLKFSPEVAKNLFVFIKKQIKDELAYRTLAKKDFKKNGVACNYKVSC